MNGPARDELRFDSYGDSALLVRRENDDRIQRWGTMQALSASLRGEGLTGIEGVVATFETMLVEFNPLFIGVDALESWLRDHAPEEDVPATTGRIVDLPVLYGGEYGPDLDDIAEYLNLTTTQVIDMHSATLWRVAFNGAPAGTPLHEGSPFDKPIPRMSSPRVHIAAGTIALAGFQGTIYTIPAPGGWRLIGRTPIQVINPKGDPFVAIQPGDQLRFRPISEREFADTPNSFIGDLL